MKKKLFLFLGILFIIIFNDGCEKKEIINIYENPAAGTLVFLTDFDAGSDVVISMTASLKSRFPGLAVDFIQAKPFNVKEAAYQLEVAAINYPAGTFFLGLVDPGANSHCMVFKAQDDKKFVVPDNGLATLVFKYMLTGDYYGVDNPLDDTGIPPSQLNFKELYLKATMGLISGKSLSSFGDPIEQPVTFNVVEPALVNDTLYGQITNTDNFGNCMTNIPDSLLDAFDTGVLFKVTGGSQPFFALYGINYSSVPPDQNIVFSSPSNLLEIAVNLGNVSQRYQLTAGAPVKLHRGMARIGILQYNDISNSYVDIMKNELIAKGFVEGDNALYIERNAGGNIAQLSSMVHEILEEGIDIMVSFSTPATQAAVSMVPDDIPIVFSIVTNPEIAGILNQRTGVTGLSNATDFNAFIGFTKRLLPAISIAGSLYNAGESNSIFSQQQLSNTCVYYGMNFFNTSVTGAGDIPSAYADIKQNHIQAILISNDNTMTLAMTDLVALALPDTIPVLGTNYVNTQDGALASISVDYDLIARETGKLVVAVIRGVNPDDVSVKYFDTNIIAINTQTAESLGYVFDPGIISEARYIYP